MALLCTPPTWKFFLGPRITLTNFFHLSSSRLCTETSKQQSSNQGPALLGISKVRLKIVCYQVNINAVLSFLRYVSALTTPARLSPVDFHCSTSAHMPTFEITSPNSAHAASLPPAASISFQVEEEQPLLRRYQVPFQDTQRYDSYYQKRGYLNESTGSLPSSPFHITEDDEYETTQEYITVLEQPKRIGGNNRRWKKSKLNGQMMHRGRMLRDSFSVSSASYSESDEELVAENTPFLSLRNTEVGDPDSPPLYRPAESRTYYSFDRCSMQGDCQLTHARSKQDSAPP